MSKYTVKGKGGCHFSLSWVWSKTNWVNLWPRCDVVPVSNVSVNKGWGNLLYLSMRSLVGNLLMIEGFVTCRTPRYVVARTVVLALSIGMFHIFASVGASIILS